MPRESSSEPSHREPIIPVQGVHHITLIGADRQTSIEFWRDTLGMPLVFEQPNLDVPDQHHLHFDPGDGRLLTVFTKESRDTDDADTEERVGQLQHIALSVSRVIFNDAKRRLRERSYEVKGPRDRGYMDSIYFHGPLGLMIELAVWNFEPPSGHTRVEVLAKAYELRQDRGSEAIEQQDVAAAIEALMSSDEICSTS